MKLGKTAVACVAGTLVIGSVVLTPPRALAISVPPPPPSAGAVPQVWPLGDSITYGLSPTGPMGGTSTPGGYRSPLDSYLNQDSVAHHFVGTEIANATPVLTREGDNSHDGHPGYRIDQIDDDLTGTAGMGTDDGGYWLTTSPQAVHPGVAIVILGGNDILQRYDPQTTFPTGNGLADYSDPSQVSSFVSDMTGRLQTLLDHIETLRPGTAIVLGDTLPIGEGKVDAVTGDYAQSVRALTDHELAAGVQITFVDLWSQFVSPSSQGNVITPGLLGTDGEHPTAAGYTTIAQTLRTPLESVLAG